MSFSREDALLALDGAITSLVTLRRILEEVPTDGPGAAPWTLPCPDDPQGGPHRPFWARDGSSGMCRTCGAEFGPQAGA